MRGELIVGVHVHAEPARLAATLSSLERTTGDLDHVLLLPDGPDAETAAMVAALGLPVSGTDEPLGPPACFNRLVATTDADAVVLLESGAIVAEHAIDRLVAALRAEPGHGLAGPSTNHAWNEQGAFPGTVDSPSAIARAARLAAARFGGAVRPLARLHSIADCCLAVRRDVVEAVGAADEGFGLGPCWEMEYSARAARAGFLAVWVGAAYVHRGPLTARRRREESLRFTASRERYQDALCGLRLSGARTGGEYEAHCRGEDCEHFAPRELIRIHRPLPAVPAAVRPPSTPAAPAASAAPAARAAPAGPPHPAATATPAGDLVSCVMPTRDRRRFALQAVRYFLRQDFPARELLVLDDGCDDLERDLPRDPRIRYERVPRGESIGTKRNRGCALARGTIIAQWDDDDWYAPDRLWAQVAPLLANRADVTALTDAVFWDLDGWQAWRASEALLQRMFRPANVVGGTLVFRRAVWERLARYPAVSLAEDAMFLRDALRRGARLESVPAAGHYVYLRHAKNSWSFQPGAFLDPGGWRRVPEPVLPPEDRTFYLAMRAGPASEPARPHEQTAAQAAAAHAGQLPLVSAVMPTRDRRRFVAQAVLCFRRQDYAARELVVVDDGEDPVEDLLPDDPRIRYVRLDRPMLLGEKRNLCNELARGDLLAHWDDDDWSAPDRLSRQVAALRTMGAELCGLRDQLYYEPRTDRAWRYTYPRGQRPWVAGNTLCYRRARWRRHPFAPVAVGEDTRFVWAAGESEPAALSEDFHIGVIHPGNSSRKVTSGAYWRPVDVAAAHRLLGPDLAFYRSLVGVGIAPGYAHS
jgi:glycosyltransferase involved in cell wall biosynthesis/GT2 family glycosyltransferase